MKKNFPVLVTIFTLTSLALSAREILCEQCEPQPEECWQHLFVERSQIFISAEFLYWKVHEGTLDYCVKNRHDNTTTHSMALGNYHTTRFDWAPGFRVGLTYYRCPRYWEVSGQYTWLHDDGSGEESGPSNPDQFLYPTRFTTISGPFTKAHGSLEFKYHLGDFFVSRVWDPNPHLRLRTLVGITAACIEQFYHLHYTNNAEEIEKVTEKWRFSGAGLRAGATFDWFWWCQFYLTGKATFAVLVGSYKNTEFQIREFDDVLVSDAKYNKSRFVTHAQFMLGPSWQIPCDCWSFELFAGYEMNVWANIHERIRSTFTFVEDSKETFYANTLVGIHGLSLRLTLGF